MADFSDLSDWIRLEQTPGVGPAFAQRLLHRFGLPSAIFRAQPDELRSLVPPPVAQALLAPPSPSVSDLIKRTLAWMHEPGNVVLTLADAAYPQALLDIGDPPLVLYAKGRHELLNKLAIAIVGSRNATRQGVMDAARFAESLTQAGWNVVSGLALGIDTAAHEGSLRAAGLQHAGSTVAVIGTGLDIVYPARNRDLSQRISEAGCLLSEYPLGTPATAANFPRRNRLISGLSRGVLVVEAAAHSGSLITARMALEQGRDVFAIPGSIHSPLSKGCHQLIKQGAKLVECAQDVLEEFGAWDMPPGGETLTAAEEPDPILEALGFAPVHIDVLASDLKKNVADLINRLLQLEIEGRVEMLPGGLYRRLD